MNVAVYSGSFNPLHIGHLAIIKYMIEVAGFDMVYLIVSPKNPLKDSISSDSGLARYNAAVEAVSRHFDIPNVACCGDDMPPPARGCSSRRSQAAGVIGATATSGSPRVRVDDIELTMPEPHYTIRTLKALHEREPYNAFTLIMGADNLACIRKWKDYQSILTDFGIAVFPREGYEMASLRQDLLTENSTYKIRLLDAPLVTISSTEIREALKRGEDTSQFMM